MDINHSLRVIAFNSLYFGKWNRPANDPAIPDMLLAWLRSQLDLTRAQTKRAVLMYHLPHGMFVSPFGNETFWARRYEERLEQLLEEYADTVSVIITGHTHISYHHYIANPAGKSYGNLVANRALSPLFINNPGFTLYHYYDKGDYAFPIKMQEFTFLTSKAYNSSENADQFWEALYDSQKDLGLINLSPGGIAEFAASLHRNPVKMLKYMLYKLGEPLPYSMDNESCLAKVRGQVQQVCGHYIEDALYSQECASKLLERFRYAEQHVDEEFTKYI